MSSTNTGLQVIWNPWQSFIDEIIFLLCGEITNESIVNARGSYGVALVIDSSEDKCESRKTMVQNQLKFSKDS